MIAALALVLAAAADTGAATAAPADSAAHAEWRAGLEYGFEAFTAGRATWQTWTARVERKAAHGSLALEALDATRFSLWDQSAALDAYRTLWRGAYGNLRVAVAPGARVLPRSDVTAELYQGIAGGWEASVGYRRMNYAGQGVDLWGASLGKYVGDWYVVAHATAVPQSGKLGGGAWLLVRRYLGTADDYLDVSGGVGAEVATLAVDSVAVSHTQFLTARAQRFLTPRLGVTLGATWNTQQGIPARRGLALGVLYRW
jgi:YaiO family outer membrane protein